MARASVRGWQLGQRPARLLGLFLLGGLLVFVTGPGSAQNPGKGQNPKQPPKKDKDAPKAGPTDTLRLALHAKSAADVQEMTKLINEKIEAGWKANKVTRSRYATDFEFIRRASLDVIGRIAKPEEIQAFLRDPEPTRRSLLIDRLLASDEYPAHWANLWTNWLLTRSGPFGQGTYHEQTSAWLREQFALNRPYDAIVKDLITAKGKNTENGAVNFILAHVGETTPAALRTELGHFEMVPLTSRITRLFLGVQVQCAQCHPHPFYDSLKQEHFWRVNAFLRQVDREGTPPVQRGRTMTHPPLTLKDNEAVNADAKVYLEKRNAVLLQVRAEFLPSGEEVKGQTLTKGAKGITRREELARYLLDHDQFPKAIVNRLWGVFLGRGFVNPVDDFNEQNKPSNPELLNELAARFKHYGYDQKKLIRWICNSTPYNLSCVTNPTNDKPEQEVLFSRMVMKSLTPEQLFESLMVATKAEVAESKKDKKALRDDWLRNLISNFGDDEGNEVNFNGTVVQALLMMNGKDINEAIARKDKGTVSLAIAHNPRSSAAVITELYLAALNRRPTPRESVHVQSCFPLQRGRDKDPAAPYQDLLWALLNSNEFLLNH
jgi:hypothetical protein